MNDAALFALFAAAAINAVIPGPGMLLAIGRSAAAGLGAGLWITSGMLLATLLMLVATWAVLLGTLTVSVALFDSLRVVGIFVLAGIAILLLRAGPAPLPETAAVPERPRQGCLGDLAGGLATGLSSPVHLLFLLAVVPQFVDVGRTGVPDMLVVTLGILVITAVPMLAVSWLAAGSGRLLELRRHWLSRAGGMAILGFAAIGALGLD